MYSLPHTHTYTHSVALEPLLLRLEKFRDAKTEVSEASSDTIQIFNEQDEASEMSRDDVVHQIEKLQSQIDELETQEASIDRDRAAATGKQPSKRARR